jgi:AraC-like DNA-binding protein
MKAQIYKIRNPNSCVSEIVEIKSDTITDNLTHFVPPFGNPEIILYVGQTHQIKNVACTNGFIKGQYNIAQKIDFILDYHFLIIRLHPYGLKQLFNINAPELVNSVMDIDSHPISKDLLKFFSVQYTAEISFLKTLLSFIEQYAVYPISTSTKQFIKLATENEIKTIKNIALEHHIGLRTLQRNFKNETGLSPKEYLRIKRMNAVEQKMSQNANVFEIIADFDFTDQAHYIKDFKQLRHFTPTETLKKKMLLSDQLAVPEITII